MSELKKKVSALLKGQKFGKDSLMILILAGLLLLVIAWPTKSAKKSADGMNGKNGQTQSVLETAAAEKTGGDLGDYAKALEEKLCELLSQMEGVGKVRVMISFAASGEETLLRDITRSDKDTTESDQNGGMRVINENSYEEATVYVTDEDGRKIPYVVRTGQPEVVGVAVIAEGGADPVIRRNITDVILSLFRIDVNRIIVTKMKS